MTYSCTVIWVFGEPDAPAKVRYIARFVAGRLKVYAIRSAFSASTADEEMQPADFRYCHGFEGSSVAIGRPQRPHS